MSTSKQNLHEMIDHRNEQQTHTVYDFARYIVDRQINDFWETVEDAPPDEHPLSEEEKRDIEEADDFVGWEEAKRELGISSGD